jgi:hypothetical protein
MSTGTDVLHLVRALLEADCINVMFNVTEHMGLDERNSCYENWIVF